LFVRVALAAVVCAKNSVKPSLLVMVALPALAVPAPPGPPNWMLPPLLVMVAMPAVLALTNEVTPLLFVIWHCLLCWC
jgi:hypothetical protein